MRVSVILLAAGLGKRMGSRTPKAFLKLAGVPLYRHSLDLFRSMKEVRQVVLVVPPGVRIPGAVVGGSRRQDSVRNGLKLVDPKSDVVLVHDSARPLISKDLVRNVIRLAFRHGAALPGIPVRDTLKRADGRGRVIATQDRSGLWAVQTPQGFRRGVLEGAYAAGHGVRSATDDAQIVERSGVKAVLSEGNPMNFKITSKIDLVLAENYLRRKKRPRTTRGTQGLPPEGRRP